MRARLIIAGIGTRRAAEKRTRRKQENRDKCYKATTTLLPVKPAWSSFLKFPLAMEHNNMVPDIGYCKL